MHHLPHHTVRLRCAATWLLVTGAVGGLAALAVPLLTATLTTLRAGDQPEFAELLVAACGAAALTAAGRLWLVTTEVVVAVLTDHRGPPTSRRPVGPLRALVLAACGVAALSSTATAATPATHLAAVAAERDPADPGSDVDRLGPHLLAGLPLPDRAIGALDGSRGEAPPRRQPRDRDPATEVRVRPGDSLWSIAAERLGPRATVVDVTTYWHRIYDRNAALIGPDPDLIHPGQQLHLPPTA